MNQKHIGDHAEMMACRFLKQQGLSLLVRNYRCRRGEIDLVMQDRDSLVFIEVRYRKSAFHGSAAESITFSKRKRITCCARHYLARHHMLNQPARFDVIAVEGTFNDNVRIEWLKDAFRPDD